VTEGLATLSGARARLVDLGEPHEVVDTDVAIAEAHLLAGRPDLALSTIERALSEAAAMRAATLLPSAHRVHAAALLVRGAIAEASAAVAEGLRHSDAPGVGLERGFLLAIAARIAHDNGDPDVDRLEQDAAAALESLGVVRLPVAQMTE
jgi:hypothetical protein